MTNILERIKKILKIQKVCSRTCYIAGHLKPPRGPRVEQPCSKAWKQEYFVYEYSSERGKIISLQQQI